MAELTDDQRAAAQEANGYRKEGKPIPADVLARIAPEWRHAFADTPSWWPSWGGKSAEAQAPTPKLTNEQLAAAKILRTTQEGIKKDNDAGFQGKSTPVWVSPEGQVSVYDPKTKPEGAILGRRVIGAGGKRTTYVDQGEVDDKGKPKWSVLSEDTDETALAAERAADFEKRRVQLAENQEQRLASQERRQANQDDARRVAAKMAEHDKAYEQGLAYYRLQVEQRKMTVDEASNELLRLNAKLSAQIQLDQNAQHAASLKIQMRGQDVNYAANISSNATSLAKDIMSRDYSPEEIESMGSLIEGWKKGSTKDVKWTPPKPRAPRYAPEDAGRWGEEALAGVQDKARVDVPGSSAATQAAVAAIGNYNPPPVPQPALPGAPPSAGVRQAQLTQAEREVADENVYGPGGGFFLPGARPPAIVSSG